MTNYLENELTHLQKNNTEISSFIQEYAVDGLWFLDVDMSNFCWFNSKIEALLGYNSVTEYSLFLNQLTNIFGHDSIIFSKKVDDKDAKHLYLNKYIHKDGTIVPMNCTCIVLYDSDGKPQRILGANSLIKKNKIPQDISHTIYESITKSLENSNFLYMVRLGINGDYNLFNEHYYQGLGFNQQQAKITDPLSTIVEEDREACRETVRKCLKNPMTPFIVILRKQTFFNEIVITQWEFTALVDDKGNPFEIFCIGNNVSEQKKIENDLSVLVANMTDLLISVNYKGIITYVSPNVTKLYNYELNEIVGKYYVDFLHHQDVELGIQTVKQALVSGVPFKNLEIRLKEKFGSYYWTNINSSINPVNKETIMVINDITARKYAKIELNRTKDFLQETNQVARIGGWELNLYTGLLYWSEITKEIHDIEGPYEPNVEKGISYYKDDKSKLIITNAVNNCIENGTPFDVELELITAKGREIWVRSIGKADFKDPNKKRIFGTFQDITPAKQAEEQLRKTTALLEETNRIARIGGWTLDVSSMKIYWSEVIKEIFGLPQDFVPTLEIGLSFYKDGCSRDLITDSVQNCITNGTPFDIEVQIVNTKNEEIWIKIIGKAEIENGIVNRIFGTFQDINQSKIAEENKKNLRDLEMLLTKEKQINQLKSRFISLTSHEFRTPLSVILGSTEILNIYNDMLEDSQIKEKIFKQLGNISTQINRLTNIVNDVLNLGKTAEGKIVVKKEPLLIKEFLEKMALDFQHQPNESRTLKLFLPDEEKEVVSDESILRHIMNNLIGNAFKYSRGVALSPELHLVYFDNYFNITVKDYGMGIPKNEQKYLFETFFRASNVIKTEGTGLGLNIAKEFTENLDGEISFDSEEGKGCTFNLKFPLRHFGMF